MLELFPLVRQMRGRRLLGVSREAVRRLSTLALAYRFEREESYLHRLEEELKAVCSFSDWNPSHFLDVAEMAAGVALALDWAGEWISQEVNEMARFALVNKALKPGLASSSDNWWITTDNNWNLVCHGGLSLAALAVYEHFAGSIQMRAVQWLWGTIAFAGLMLIMGVNIAQISFIGVALAVLAMLSSVVITLVNGKVVEQVGSLVSNLYMSLWGVAIFGLALLLFGQFNQPQTTIGWIALSGNGVAYCISWVAFFSGARILGATRAAMITLIEPPMAAVFAWFIFGETFTLLQWFGFAVVLASLVMFEKLARNHR